MDIVEHAKLVLAGKPPRSYVESALEFAEHIARTYSPLKPVLEISFGPIPKEELPPTVSSE
jgi:hypothetical protein